MIDRETDRQRPTDREKGEKGEGSIKRERRREREREREREKERERRRERKRERKDLYSISVLWSCRRQFDRSDLDLKWKYFSGSLQFHSGDRQTDRQTEWKLFDGHQNPE